MIPFGVSFGDFVAGITLLKSLIDALDGTFGAKAEYRGLISELYCLERALVAIKEIEVRENSSEFDATQQAVRGCRECIDRFILKIASYQSLTAGKSSIRDQVRKITWSQCRKEDLHKFKEDLSVYVSTINVLLNTLQLSYSKEANLTTLASVDAQTHLLREVNDTIKNSDSSHNEILQRMERLLQNLQPQQAEPPSSSFLVRPLRLIDAPIAPNFVSRKQIMPGMDGEDQEKNRKDDNNLANATLKSSEWVVKLKPFVDFIANVPEKKPSVRVALIDDGANLINLDGVRVQGGESFRSDNVAYFVGPCSHGTEMARCIGAICPMAELYIARLDDSRERDGGAFTIASAYKALKWAISMEVDIISMSWSFKMKGKEMDEYEKKFIAMIRGITSSGGSKRPILFGSFPDKGPTAEASDYAPVGIPGVIGIASATINGEPSKENAQERPNFLLPGEKLLMPTGEIVSGSSFSTAYASGLAALVLYCLRAHKELLGDDSDDERHKRLKIAETGDGMKKIFRNLTWSPADNTNKTYPFVRPYFILGDKSFELSGELKRKTMQDIVTQLLPISQLNF